MSRFTDLIDTFETEFNDSSVTFVVGNENKRRRGSRRRIHFYRTGGPIVTHSRTGGTKVGIERVTCSFERRGVIEAHIFAESDDTSETILDNLIATIYRTLELGFEFLGYDWDDDQVNQRGPYIILRFSVAHPVPNENSELVTLTGEETDTNWIELQ